MDEPSRTKKAFKQNNLNANKLIKITNTMLPEVDENDGFQRSCFDPRQSKKCK